MGKNISSVNVRQLTYLAILTAIVFVLQFVSLFMRFATFSLTFVLIPIVIGVAVCGKWSGAWLGLVFGAAVFATGDATFFMGFDVFGTIVTVMLKGILAGLVAGLVYSVLQNKNKVFAIYAAAVTAPIVNTGVFVLGCYTFFLDDITAMANGGNVFTFIIVTFVGINFIIELALNVLLSPAIIRLLRII